MNHFVCSIFSLMLPFVWVSGQKEAVEDEREPLILKVEATVISVAFSGDGKLLATGCQPGIRPGIRGGTRPSIDDGTVKLWDVATGKLTATLRGHTETVDSVAFDADGKLLATGSRPEAKLWDVATGKEIATFKGNSRFVTLSGNGKRLATGSFGTVKVWDVATRKQIAALKAGAVCSLAFSADSTVLAAGSFDGVKAWEVATGKEQAELKGPGESLYSVAFTEESKLLALNRQDGTIWDVAIGKKLSTLKGPFSRWNSASFRIDAGLLATGSQDNTAILWDPATGEEIARLRPLHGGSDVTCVAFRGDGKLLAACAKDEVRLWDVSKAMLKAARTRGKKADQIQAPTAAKRGSDVERFQADVNVHTLVFVGDGKTLLSLGTDGSQLWDVRTGRLLRADDRFPPRTAGELPLIAPFALSPDARFVAVGSLYQPRLTLLEVTTGKELRALKGLAVEELTNVSMSFSRDGRLLALGGVPGIIHVWETATGKELHRLRWQQDMENSAVAFSPDGNLLAAGNRHGRISLWELATGKLLRTVGRAQPFERVNTLSFSGDGKVFASCTSNDPFRLWDVATGKQLFQLPRGEMVFSPRGQLLASWGPEDNIIHLQDAATRKERRLEGHSDDITYLAFSPDGKTLASTARDQTLRFWDVGTGKQRFVHKQQGELIQCLAFSPDGKLVASFPGSDGKIQLWASDQRTGSAPKTKDEPSPANLRQISLAMWVYLDNHGRFPPAAIWDKEGKPLLSWRVALLPSLEQQKLYDQFKLDEPWDSEHNKKLLAQMPAIYALPESTPIATMTHYRVFVGPQAGFEWCKGRRVADITDGLSNTFMVVEAADAVPWTKPDELAYDPRKPLPKLGGCYAGGFHVSFMDGSVRLLSHALPEKTLRALITPQGNEVIQLPD
jgi:WD40 repeat protein